jgi:pimeloyl-ACP methyl ester carboxylesterase
LAGQTTKPLPHCSTTAPKSAREAAGLLRPMNPIVRARPLTTAAWRDLPSTIVHVSEDRMPAILTPAFFDHDPEVITLPTGHCPNWSRPDLVAELLLSPAEQITRTADQVVTIPPQG